ncbi:hypothetical protein [Actinoplanes sp. M2I2]|uniref:hypothetical protein n=1 Tax=Actinoplanes sp. M2I2 TaxID=1734444 RepID=UPI00202056A4|nr:hypothetical protein [Actinoplanes sp. M2I2]
MNRKQVLIAVVSVLGVALATVLTGIVTGFLPTARAEDPPRAAPAAAAAAAQAAGPEQARYVGRSQDGAFTVAVHVWQNSAIAHVTDGVSREAWVKGTAGGDRLLLAGAGGEVLEARLTDGTAAGSAEFNGGKVAFSLPQVSAPAGVYRATGGNDGRPVRVDVIVLPDRRASGIEWVDGRPSTVQAADLTGQTVRVGDDELRLEAIRPGDV